ncbi:hypothetical protein CRYUN_Cryun06bG0158900 [Craigia yunnanensis]
MIKPDEESESCTNAPSNQTGAVADDKLTVTMREEAPEHCILEIESIMFLSRILSKTGLDRYESPEFKASGYNWRLIVYPEGDKKRNGGGHISLYLEIVGIQKLGRAREIDALLNFFVFNQRNNQYVSIQDGRVKRFNAVKTEWGFSRLLPLTEFNDTSKGYLDRCKFGVEVFVIKSELHNGECFSTIDNPNKNKFSWKVEDFSKLKEASQYSKEFTVGDYNWRLHLYPKGVPKVKGAFLSIFLCLQDSKNISSGSKMHVKFKLRINDQFQDNNSEKTEKTGNAWFSSAFDNAWGFPYFIKLADLEKAKGLIVNDDVLFEAEISSMSITKDLSPDPPPNTMADTGSSETSF